MTNSQIALCISKKARYIHIHKRYCYLHIALTMILICITQSLFAYDYSHCMKYFNAASTPVGSSYAISLKNGTKQHHILYATTTPRNVKILKADPFIGLYLIEAPNTKQSYELLALDARTLKDKNLAFISSKKVQKGHITKRQSGFIRYAQFSATAEANSVLGNICYQIYGISVGNNRFMEKKYIDRFLSQKTPYYGDLGIRFADFKAIVHFIDPFAANNPFEPNDEILSINGTKVNTSDEAEWIISNLKQDSMAKILLKRKGKTLTFNVKVTKRYGGFLLQETFLERFGIALDSEMNILSINHANAGRFSALRAGDRILWINKEPIITESTSSAHQRFQRLKFLLSQARFDERFDGKMQLLIMRDNLEIFLKV